jgi:hypothetical protein
MQEEQQSSRRREVESGLPPLHHLICILEVCKSTSPRCDIVAPAARDPLGANPQVPAAGKQRRQKSGAHLGAFWVSFSIRAIK